MVLPVAQVTTIVVLQPCSGSRTTSVGTGQTTDIRTDNVMRVMLCTHCGTGHKIVTK